MSHVVTPAAPTQPASRRRVSPDLLVGVGCALLAFVVTAYVLRHFGFGGRQQLRIWPTLAGTVVAPGLIVTRRLPLSWAPRLGAAFVAGVAVQLIGWAVAVSSGVTVLLWVMPLLVAVLFDAVAGLLGRRWPTPEAAPRRVTPWWAAMAMLASWVLLLRSAAVNYWSVTSFDGKARWYQDVFWQIGVSADAMHHVPPTDPNSAVEGALSYHWFSNAHTAALALAGGLDLTRLSVVAVIVPAAAATVALVYGLATHLARTPVAGALAVLTLPVPLDLVLRRGMDIGGTSTLAWLSPSHLFALPVSVFATWLLVDLLRGGRTRPAAVMVTALVALLVPGSKVSLLPTLLGGVGFVGLQALVRRRGILRPLVVGVVGSIVVVGTLPFVGGGGGGSQLKFAATPDQLVTRGIVLGSSRHNLPTLALLCLALLGTWTVTLLVVAARREDKDDPAPAFYAGLMTVALGAVMFLAHPGRSQVYFMLGIGAISSAFVAWGVVAAVRHAARVRTDAPIIAVAATAIGAYGGVVFAGSWLLRPAMPVHWHWLVPVGALYLTIAGVLVWLLSDRRPHVALAGAVAACLVFGFSAGVPTARATSGPSGWAARPAFPWMPPLTPDEQQGAAALARLNPQADLVATNVHCTRIVTRPTCDTRGFWVSGLGRSPVLIGGWGYSSSARVMQGNGGRVATRQPYFDRPLFDLNESAFAAPTRQNLEALRAKKVRFLFADARASHVSPQLRTLTREVWSSPTVQVYELR